MSDVPHPRTHSIDFSQEDVDITEAEGPDVETSDDLDTGAASTADSAPDVLELSDTAKRFLATPEDDEPSDDASGVEVPQDGDAGR